MTKQEFLEGKSFYLPNQRLMKGATSYSFNLPNNNKSAESGYLIQEMRYSSNNDIHNKSYEANLNKITDNTFSFINYVLGKEVKGRYKFVDLIKVEDVDFN